jgi:hypothetical protein
MITTFKLFETKLRDLISDTKKLNNDVNSIEKTIIDNQLNKEFVNDTKLINQLYLKEFDRILRFRYNDNADHNLIKRIKERTHLKSISEFNEFFKKVIKTIIPNKLGKGKIDKKAVYALHMKENNFYILILIDPNALIDDNYVNYYGVSFPYYLYVVTILQETEFYNYYRMFEIDDSSF